MHKRYLLVQLIRPQALDLSTVAVKSSKKAIASIRWPLLYLALELVSITSMVDLSGADSGKWGPLLEHSHRVRSKPQIDAPTDDSKHTRLTAPRQRQKRLNASEVDEIVEAYLSGLSVYQLSRRFGCHRTTISNHLKSRGVAMRLTPLTESQIDHAIELYGTGLSLAKVGMLVGADAETVRQQLSKRGVQLRGPHERRGRD